MATAASSAAATPERGLPPKYAARPDETIVKAFFDHPAATGEPHTWAQHLHAPPSRQAKPVLLTSFALPDKFKSRPDHWAMCPLCAPSLPKYTWGYLVWFPEAEGGDGHLRAIGHDCGARFFGKERYRQAVNVFKREQDEQAERAYVERVRAALAPVITWVEAIAPWSNAAQVMRSDFRLALPREFVDALGRLEAGALTVAKPVAVTFQRADGGTGTRTEFQREQVARVRGQEILAHGVANIEEQRVLAAKILNDLSRLPAELDADAIFVAAKAARKLKEHVSAVVRGVSAAIEFALHWRMRAHDRPYCGVARRRQRQCDRIRKRIMAGRLQRNLGHTQFSQRRPRPAVFDGDSSRLSAGR